MEQLPIGAGEVACPTCGARGTQMCVRGRAPRWQVSIGTNLPGDLAMVWRQQIPFPEGHDSRRSANKKKEN